MLSQRIIGLDDEQLDELTSRLEERFDWHKQIGRPREMTLVQSVRAVLLYERHNTTQELIAWIYGVSQGLISTLIRDFEPHIEAVLDEFVPDPAETFTGQVPLVDGSLLPCWSYKDHPELWSGKHKTTGHLTQIVTDLADNVLAVSDPYPGSWHDTAAYADTGWAAHIGEQGGIGDKGYQGTNLLTPTKKPRLGELSPTDKANNKHLNSLRSASERGIAHFKSWRIFHTDYRRPRRTFPQAFRTTRALYFFSVAY